METLTEEEVNFIKVVAELESNHAGWKGHKRRARLSRHKCIILLKKLEHIEIGMIYIINNHVWFIF